MEYKAGDIIAINEKKMTPAQVLTELNRLGRQNTVWAVWMSWKIGTSA